MTTKQAFIKLLNHKELILSLDFSESRVRTLKYRANTNKVSLKTMEKYLLLSGFKKIPEQWSCV